MNPRVAAIQAEANYQLRILFTNGEMGVSDILTSGKMP